MHYGYVAMKQVFTKPLAHFIPLPQGNDATMLATLTDEELHDVLCRSRQVEEEQVYQVNPDLIVREIGDEWMLVPTGEFAQHFNGMISLNFFSHYILQQFEQPTSLGAVLSAAHEQFNDPHHMLDIQVRKLVVDFAQMGVLARVKNNNIK